MGQVYLQVKMDSELKAKAESILSKLELPPAIAISTFYRQVILRNGLPFDIHLPENSECIEEPGNSEVQSTGSIVPKFDENELKKTQAGRLLILMRELHKKGILTEKGLFKTDIEKYYHQRFKDDKPKDLAQALSDGCNPDFAGKLGLVYERVSREGKKRTGIYRLRQEAIG